MPRAPFIVLMPATPPAWLPQALPAEDTAELATLRHPGARARGALSRWLRRQVLAMQRGQPPESLRFARGAHGRPYLVGGGPDFNLSHAGDWIAVGVADGRIGVDLERARPRRWQALAARVLDPAEREEVRDLAGFLQRWTLKEAWLKALGTGIAGGMARTRFRIDGERIRGSRPELPADHGWQFAQCWLDADHCLAWAVSGNAADSVRLLRGRPDPERPRLLLAAQPLDARAGLRSGAAAPR